MTEVTTVERDVTVQFQRLLAGARNSTDDRLAASIEEDVIAPWDRERRSLQKVGHLRSRQQVFVNVMLSYMEGREAAWPGTWQPCIAEYR